MSRDLTKTTRKKIKEENMAAVKRCRSSWLHPENSTEENEEDGELLVFGYSCKLFRDDEKALYIDQGKHLIPWMGDESHMIDRYDGRGYIHDLQQYEPVPGRDLWEELSPEERHLENVFNEERYLALKTNLVEEEQYHEEELKRLRAALADDGAYSQVGFSYADGGEAPVPVNDSGQQQKNDEGGGESSSSGELEDDFVPAKELNVPQGTEVPSSSKLNAIVEKTALFVVQQGPQMEIVIKTKQASNPQFSFLAFDHPLNPYYKHVIQMIKQAKYIPKPQPAKNNSEGDDEDEDDDDEDNDGHYLHPSLLSAKKEKELTVPKLNYAKSGDDRYSLLVSRLKDKVQADVQLLANSVMNGGEDLAASSNSQCETVMPPPPGLEPVTLPVPGVGGPAKGSFDELSSATCAAAESVVVWPPPDLAPIIDKMASYVAKNGEHFEAVVKAKSAGSDPRFEFLNVGHPYHAYYQFKRKSFETECSAAAVPASVVSADDDAVPDKELKAVVTGVVSFSIKMREATASDKFKAGFVGDDEATSPTENSAAAVPPVAVMKAEIPAEELEREKSLKAKLEEARLAEQKIKDRLAAAARERLAQASREKQLQLERKRKAALFLTMLRKDKDDDDPNLIGPRLPTAIEMTQMIIRENSPPLALALATGGGETIDSRSSGRLHRRSSSPPARSRGGTSSGSPPPSAAAAPSSRSSSSFRRSRSGSRHRSRSDSRERSRRHDGKRHRGSRSPGRHHHRRRSGERRSRSAEKRRRSRSRSRSSSSRRRHHSRDRDRSERAKTRTPPAAYAIKRKSCTPPPLPSAKRRSRRSSSRSPSPSPSKHRRRRGGSRTRRMSGSTSPPPQQQQSDYHRSGFSRSRSRRRSGSGSRGRSKGRSRGRSVSPKHKKS